MEADGPTPVRRGARVAAAGVVALLLASCGAESARPVVVEVPETVAIGGMPGPLSDTSLPTLPPLTLDPTTTTSAPTPEPIVGPLVDEVLGHRVLLVGDTAMAATTPRAGGIMCDVVTGFGWDLEIEAEPGRTIEFADEVLDERLAEGWDVVGLMFGHHLAGTVDDFERLLDALLDRLDQQPVVLYTVAEIDAEQRQVNAIIRDRQRSRPGVVVVDWAAAAADEPDILLDEGGPTPTAEGAGRIALFTAALLGRTPDGEPGTCFDAVFTDDSAIVL